MRHRSLVLVGFLGVSISAISAQVVASGQKLTVTSANAIAAFQGPDLVGLTNSSTGEAYLKSAPPNPLMNLEINGGPSSNLQASNWTTSVQGGTTVAALTMTDSVRSVTINVSVDPSSQEIVITFSGQATQTGVSAAYWGIAGLDLVDGHLVVPASSGIVIDQKHVQLGSTLQYPLDWQAQMAVYETSMGSMVLYSTDSQYQFKQLRIASHATSTIDLSIATQPNGPFSADTSVPSVEWRLKAFAGDWRTAAAVYRDWLATNRPHVSNANHAWVNNISTVVQLGTRDTSVLNTLATEVTPSKTLLYMVDWRNYGYDVNYPDYTPASDVASYVAQAHALGFKVMLHTDLIGVAPTNPDFATVQQWQLKDPQSLQLEGWNWSSPPSTPQRYALIDPASSVYRNLFISRVTTAVSTVQPDALHLDFSGLYNDGNGLIDGMNYTQGSVQLHKDLIAAFPNLAFGDEGMYDPLYPFDSFAQNWFTGDNKALLGHPIANFLWNSQSGGPQILYYGHLGQPAASAPGFIDYLTPIEREGILPALAINSATDVDLTNPDNARLNRWLTSWQTNMFQPDWTGSWSGVLIPYKGVSNATASLTDNGTIISLNSGGSAIYQRTHDVNQIGSTNYILNWPAFDAANLYGLDPTQQYWLDAIARPNTTHVSSLSSGIEMDADTAVSSAFALFQFAPTPSYDFFGNLWAASIGTTFNGTDGPLAYGATAQLTSTTAGGVSREGIFMQPPYMQGRAGGEAFVEWMVPIPQFTTFSFSVGVADSAGTCTDGVTFRVAVNGVEQWRQNVLHQGWVDGSVNLYGYAGTTARLRIVTNPGPANNPNCDWASFSNLALVTAAGTTSVPVVLGSGATASGFSGSGTYSSNTGTVSGVSVPGEFVLFTAPGSAVSVGTSLASLPFTTWLGADGEMAMPGTIFGSGSIGNPTSGGVTKTNAIFGHPPGNGRTILNWTLALPSTGNLSLGWSAGIQDGSLTSTGVQFSVRINGFTYWTQFQPHPAGWTPGSLDLSTWRGQNILVQLVTDSVGNNDYDWGWWADLKLTQGGTSPPAAPVLIAPANATTVGNLNPTLTWSASAGAVSYDVYFGPSSPPSIVANITTTSYSPGPLREGPYYWAIVARSNTGTAGSVVAQFTTTIVPVVRDFGGNGRSGVLLYDPSQGQSYTAVSNGNGTYNYVPNTFTPGFDTLRSGDFNGDGKADLVVYNSHTALAYIGMGNGDGTFAFQSLFWSPGYDFVEPGDLNGDGKTDFALYNSSTGTMYTGISNGDGTFTYKYTLISRGFTVLRLADFNGDGKADIFLYRASDGLAYLGIGDGTGGFAFNPLFISAGYNLADSADLNGDGKADIILYNATNGNAATGLSNGSGGFAFTPLIFSAGFTSVKLADYIGDGKAGVTVYNKNTAAAYFGTGTGTGTFTFQSLFWSPGYDWVLPQDVNGDGKIDVVLYNSLDGTEYTGISNGDGTFGYTYQYWGIGKVLAQ